MAIDVGSGNVADRLRNFLRLTGRIPLKMDEMVVPVVVGQQLDQPPWRTADQNFAATVVTSPAPAAGFFAIAGVEMPNGASGVARVTQITIRSNIAAEYSIFVGARQGTNYSAQGRVFNTENATPVPALIPTLAPVFYQADVNPLALNAEICRVVAGGQGTIVVPVDVCLRGNFGQSTTVGQACFVAIRTAATAECVSFSGTFYPQAL